MIFVDSSYRIALQLRRERKLRIEEALAFGGDFAAAGFTELRV